MGGGNHVVLQRLCLRILECVTPLHYRGPLTALFFFPPMLLDTALLVLDVLL